MKEALAAVRGMSLDDVTKTELILWLCGAKRDLLSTIEIRYYIKKSNSFGINKMTGCEWTSMAWECLIRQAVKLGYLQFLFHTFFLKGTGIQKLTGALLQHEKVKTSLTLQSVMVASDSIFTKKYLPACLIKLILLFHLDITKMIQRRQ